MLQKDSGINATYSSREKRSLVSASDYLGKITRQVVTWRLIRSAGYSTIPLDTQNSVLALALSYWAQVLPLCFRNDMTSPRVDIEFGFYQGMFGRLTQYTQILKQKYRKFSGRFCLFLGVVPFFQNLQLGNI